MDDDAAINFYTGIESYQMLVVCFQYLGKSVNIEGKSHIP